MGTLEDISVFEDCRVLDQLAAQATAHLNSVTTSQVGNK
jgi:hypothetical protein